MVMKLHPNSDLEYITKSVQVILQWENTILTLFDAFILFGYDETFGEIIVLIGTKQCCVNCICAF